MGWCREAATRFADARVQAFVPLLVERIVGDRIRRDRVGRGGAPAVMECAGREVSR
ncbi:three-helix bundle dimerization domain-containing protein [Mycolicibacterium mucogenicum]